MHNPWPSLTTAQNWPLEVQAGQLLMPAAFINDTEDEIRILEGYIRNHHVGGLCFFHSRASAATNFEGKKEIPHNPDSLGTLRALIQRYQKAAPYPLLMAIDAEWGLAMRIENGEAYPYALALGALEDQDPLLYQTGLRMAADCREAGLHWNLAPVADVNNNPGNPVIGYRSFGSRPESVAQKALALARGMQDGGVLVCAKHFPGHGNTDTDSHLELPRLGQARAELEATEFPPFRTLIGQGVDAVMTGHLAVPALDPTGTPSSLSAPMIQGVLRNAMGFKGAVITDALNMHAVSRIYPEPGEVALRALLAGNDMLCFVEDLPAAHARIVARAGKDRIRDAFQKVWALKEKAFNPKAAPVLPEKDPATLRKELAAASLSPLGAPQPLPSGPGAPAFTLIAAGAGLDPFVQALEHPAVAERLRWDLERPDASLPLPAHKDVLLALQPPSLKPPGRFGMSEAAVAAIIQLRRTHRVQLCHFGNPYALQVLGAGGAEGTLLAYQPLPECQQQAAAFYRGEAPAPGMLPVSLNLESP